VGLVADRRHTRPSRCCYTAETANARMLDGLLDQVRVGRSGVLRLRGQAGIGKTALLRYLVDAGSSLTLVVRCTGV